MASGSGWNLWVRLESMGLVSSRWMWVESVVVASGCGCKEVYRYRHITYLSLLLLYLFFFSAASLIFAHFLCFSFFISSH